MPLCPDCKSEARFTSRPAHSPGHFGRFMEGVVEGLASLTPEPETETVTRECDRCEQTFEETREVGR